MTRITTLWTSTTSYTKVYALLANYIISSIIKITVLTATTSTHLTSWMRTWIAIWSCRTTSFTLVFALLALRVITSIIIISITTIATASYISCIMRARITVRWVITAGTTLVITALAISYPIVEITCLAITIRCIALPIGTLAS